MSARVFSVAIAVPDWALPDIGSNLCRERAARGVSVPKLAEAVGMSRSGLYSIECGAARPSVSTLRALAAELGISIDALFSANGSRAAGPRCAVVRAAERRKARRCSGVELATLTPAMGAGRLIRARYPPGSSHDWPRWADKGRALVVSGHLRVGLGDETYQLSAGDAICFDATQPHRIEALGDQPAEAIWAVIKRRP
jgi:DNA-binding XRE family transcriptional regulator